MQLKETETRADLFFFAPRLSFLFWLALQLHNNLLFLNNVVTKSYVIFLLTVVQLYALPYPTSAII